MLVVVNRKVEIRLRLRILVSIRASSSEQHKRSNDQDDATTQRQSDGQVDSPFGVRVRRI